MNIPHYWAKAEMEGRNRQGDVLPFVAWGSSDRNTDDARRQAQHKVEALVARFQSGEKLPHSGQNYYGGDRPLREEILQEFSSGDSPDAAIVTRNSYGCSVLNAARLMFIDIDLPPQLIDEEGHELEAEGIGHPKVEALRESGAVVGHDHAIAPAAEVVQPDPEGTGTARREAVLEGVDDEFVGDESAGNGGIDVQGNV